MDPLWYNRDAAGISWLPEDSFSLSTGLEHSDRGILRFRYAAVPSFLYALSLGLAQKDFLSDEQRELILNQSRIPYADTDVNTFVEEIGDFSSLAQTIWTRQLPAGATRPQSELDRQFGFDLLERVLSDNGLTRSKNDIVLRTNRNHPDYPHPQYFIVQPQSQGLIGARINTRGTKCDARTFDIPAREHIIGKLLTYYGEGVAGALNLLASGIDDPFAIVEANEAAMEKKD